MLLIEWALYLMFWTSALAMAARGLLSIWRHFLNRYTEATSLIMAIICLATACLFGLLGNLTRTLL